LLLFSVFPHLFCCCRRCLHETMGTSSDPLLLSFFFWLPVMLQARFV
jgi:hypothetical protein